MLVESQGSLGRMLNHWGCWSSWWLLFNETHPFIALDSFSIHSPNRSNWKEISINNQDTSKYILGCGLQENIYVVQNISELLTWSDLGVRDFSDKLSLQSSSLMGVEKSLSTNSVCWPSSFRDKSVCWESSLTWQKPSRVSALIAGGGSGLSTVPLVWGGVSAGAGSERAGASDGGSSSTSIQLVPSSLTSTFRGGGSSSTGSGSGACHNKVHTMIETYPHHLQNIL